MTPFRLGLTGGMGSGKSTAAAALVSCGAQLIDADAISRALTAPGGEAIAAIAQAFGPLALDAAGGLNRTQMRDWVFQDLAAKLRLEGIIHPLVGVATARALAACTSALVVHDVPLLVESGRWRGALDAVLVIDCLPSTQVERVMARSALDQATVLRIMATQATRSQRLAAADHVVFNDGISVQALQAQLTTLAHTLIAARQPV